MRVRGRPREEGGTVAELCLDVRAEVEGEPDIVAAAADNHVGDLKAGHLRIEPHRPAVPCRWAERRVPVVLRGPAQVGGLDFPRPRVALPHERTAFNGLAAPGKLDGVVRDR
jgi:hypothetical protein